MKITFVTAPMNFSGGARVTRLHAAMLQDRGHEVNLVSPPPRKLSRRDKFRLFKSGRIEQLFATQPTMPSDDHKLNYIVLDTHRPITNDDVPDADVIISTWWETAEWCAPLAPRKGAKVYFVQGHEVYDHLPVERAKATYQFPMHKIVVSDWLQQLMANEYGDDTSDIVPNAVDTDRFSIGNRKKNSILTVGFVYSKLGTKAVNVAITSVIKAREIIPNMQVRSFGSQKPDTSVPLPSWIDFQRSPPQEEIPGIYGSCDIWLFPSKTEGFGLPILEAMACGTPVIGSPAGAAPQYVNDNTGALVKSEPSSFVEQIVRFAEMNEDDWLQKSTNARQRVAGYTWNDASILFEAALSKAIQKSNA